MDEKEIITIKEKLREFIYDDYHRLEDFSDIEVCCEDDLEIAEDRVDNALDNLITTDDIIQMYKETKDYSIDLIKWGSKYGNGSFEN